MPTAALHHALATIPSLPRRSVGRRPVVVGGPTIGRPLLDVAKNGIQPEWVGRERTSRHGPARNGREVFGTRKLCASRAIVVAAVAQGMAHAHVVAPPVGCARTGPCRILPLRLARQPVWPAVPVRTCQPCPAVQPPHIRHRVLPGDARNRVSVGLFKIGGGPCVRVRRAHPPCAPQPAWPGPVAGFPHKGCELPSHDRVQAKREWSGDRDLALRVFRGQPPRRDLVGVLPEEREQGVGFCLGRHRCQNTLCVLFRGPHQELARRHNHHIRTVGAVPEPRSRSHGRCRLGESTSRDK